MGWIGCSLPDHIEMLVSSSSECDLCDFLWKWKHYRWTKLGWGRTEIGRPLIDMTGVPIKRGNSQIGIQAERRPCEDEDRVPECFYKPRNARDCQQTTRGQAKNVEHTLHHYSSCQVWGLILCVSLAGPQCPIIGSNIILDVSVKLYFG